MNKIKYSLFLTIFLSACNTNMYCINPEDITDMYSSYVQEWQNKAKNSFTKAEGEIFIIKPKPDEIVGPNPDVNKCICKGLGIIVQGDGHKTPCPYHHKGDQFQTKSR